MNRIKKWLLYFPTLKALAIWELRTRYAGTLGGVIWSIVLPITMALVYWYVFAVGLRAQGPDNVPYIIWFMCGFIPWTTFNECITNNVNAINRCSHLVKNIIFPLEIIPLINIVVSQVTHVILLLILVILLIINHIPINLYTLQFFYYFFALLVFSVGLSFFVSSLNVFCRDLGQMLTIILNIWFWLTPIVWMTNGLSQTTQKIMLFNPMYYIVNGYRDTFIYSQPFWGLIGPTLFFWIISALLLFGGGRVFVKLKVDFADAL